MKRNPYNICKKHFDSGSSMELNVLVECNDCNNLSGYVLVSTNGAVFLAGELPNFFGREEDAKTFAKKYGIAKSWKPKACTVFIH